MCGIAGIIGRLDDGHRQALRRMSAAMAHRGPDGEGTWCSAPDDGGWGALLAHRRLAVLDLSPAGRQPMVDPVTWEVIAFNGEIYGHQALRARLEAQGQRFGSSGDTAVLLRALGLEGPAALGRLRGMYALARWDGARRELLLARDPLGMKPLYLARPTEPGAPWALAFASEVRALLASGLLGRPRLDPSAVASLTWNGFVAGPGTAVRGVSLLGAGEARTFDGRGVERRAERTWSAAPRPQAPPTGEAALGRALEEDVRLHLASDVPLAIFLSGGVDSSAVANLARRASEAPVHTFTLSLEVPELDEGPAARRVAAALGTVHHEVPLDEAAFLDRVEGAVAGLDQPSFDGVNAFVLSRAIREAGFTVALSGAGGDELFGGYPTFRWLPRLARLVRVAGRLPRPLAGAAAALAAGPWRRQGRGAGPGRQGGLAKLPELVAGGGDLTRLYQVAYALFLPDFQRELLGPEARGAVEDGLSPPFREALEAELLGRGGAAAVSVLEHRLFLGERLLRDNDAASMAASLEQRMPLVDRVLFEQVDRLPDALRFRPAGRKALLRRVGLAGLDPALFERPKRGFVLPFDRWLRRGLRAQVGSTLLDPSAVRAAGLSPAPVARLWRAFLDGAPGLYWSRPWALYAHVRWCERHGVTA